MALFGAPNIARLEAKANVKGLLRALTHEQPTIRAAAAQALGRVSSSEAVGPLISALMDHEVAVHVMAAQALGELGDPAAVQALTLVLASPPIERQLAAMHALGQIGNAPALDGITSTLQLDSDALDEQAALALAQAGPTQLPRLLEMLADEPPRVPGAAKRALSAMGQPAIAALVKLAADSDATQAERATAALGSIATPGALSELVKMLSTASYGLRDKAQAALVAVGADALAPLTAAIESDNQNAKRAAIQALGATGLEEAIPVLARVVNEGPKPLARAAVQALAQLKTDAIALPLISALHNDDWLMRQHAVQGLANLWPTPEIIAGLTALLYDGNATVRKEAQQALAKLGWEPVEVADCVGVYAAQQQWQQIPALGPEAATAVARLMPLLFSGDKTQAAETLAALGQAAYDPLLELLSDKDTGTRAAAAHGLGELGDPRATSALLTELAKDDGNSGAAAATALGELSALEAVEALARAAAQGSTTVRTAAVQALGRLGQPGEAALLTLSHSASAYVAKSALAGLAVQATAPATARILDLMGDTREEVQRQAIVTAVELGAMVIAPAAERLRHGDEAMRALMADLLGHIGQREAEGPLLRSLWHPHEGTRLAAARALEMLGAPQLDARFDADQVQMVYTLTLARVELDGVVRQWLEGEALRDLAEANPALDRLHTHLAADESLLCSGSAPVGPFGHNLISMVAWFKAWLLGQHIALPAWDGWFYHREITLEGDAPQTVAVLIYYQPHA